MIRALFEVGHSVDQHRAQKEGRKLLVGQSLELCSSGFLSL